MSDGVWNMGEKGVGVVDSRVYGDHHLVDKAEILDQAVVIGSCFYS
jgi:hypothetical protein